MTELGIADCINQTCPWSGKPVQAKMPFRATNAATWSPIIRIGAKMVVIRRQMHVERFRATLNGLGGFHMGNPGSNVRSGFHALAQAGADARSGVAAAPMGR